MFIELVDALRCPNPHEESWLVAQADRMEARHIVTGTLGCPVCSAQFPIRDGVVDFRRVGTSVSSRQKESTDPTTLAALLDLTDAMGFAVLLGGWGTLAHELSAIIDTPLIAVDPPDDVVGAAGISVLRCDGKVPIAPGVARAIAIDGGGPERTASAIRSVRSGGRLVGHVSVPLPGDVTEIARDESLWVGERVAATPLVTLHVRRGV